MCKLFFRFLVLFGVFSSLVFGNDETIKQAFDSKTSNVQVQGIGQVIRLLPDDTKGSKHQKFLLKLNNSQTILISHNIDLAPRINSLQEGDIVEFYGEYEWNEKGGVIHWTHKDNRKNHIDGWLIHDDKKYE